MKSAKRFISLFLCITMMLGLFAFPAFAANKTRDTTIHYNGIRIKIDNKLLNPCDVSGNKVEPFIMDGSTYLPVRAIAGALALDVKWDETTSTVHLSDADKPTLWEGKPLSSKAEKDVTITYRNIKLVLNNKALTPTDAAGNAVEPFILDGTTYLPLRAVANALGLTVAWDAATYTASLTSAPAEDTKPTVPAQPEAVAFETKTVSTSQGDVKSYVLTVDTSDPGVRVESRMVNNTLGATDLFSNIVKESGALAVINGNFFNSYDKFQIPIGHVMVNGEFLYGVSGLSCLGIGENGKLQIGRPGVFTRIQSGGSNSWAAYEVNSTVQEYWNSILYTPAYGDELVSNIDAKIMVAENGKISQYRDIYAGETVGIPDSGFVFWMGSEFTSTNYFRTPKVGSSVKLEYFLQSRDEEGFNLKGVHSILAGAPRLVKDGAIYTQLEAGFEEQRFTTAVTPRTAVGINSDGKLVIASVPSASIQQMRELMLALDCEDAFNLDGGGSWGLYYDGKYYATPGRKLTTTLHIFADK